MLKGVSERYYPAPGQKFFLKGGGESDFPSYHYRGPDTPPAAELVKMGFKPPFYADLPSMPEPERRAIWGLMVGQEGKTRIPIPRTCTEAGFDPQRDLLQSYADGWRSATFLPDERQFFGLAGGIMNDWDLRTTSRGCTRRATSSSPPTVMGTRRPPGTTPGGMPPAMPGRRRSRGSSRLKWRRSGLARSPLSAVRPESPGSISPCGSPR